MKIKWWNITFKSKVEGENRGGFYPFKGTENDVLEEIKKIKAEHKARGRRPKISYEELKDWEVEVVK